MADKKVSPKKIELRGDGQVVPIKFGAFGETGSGKSFTAAMFAVGLSVELHGGAPVYAYDTEPGWQFYKRIFATEGVQLIQKPGDSFDGLVQARIDADKEGACVFVGDSYTHVWQELMKTYTSRAGFVEFQDWNLLKPRWRSWIKEFMNTKMHCMALGRLGWSYIPEEDERKPGKVKMVKSDSKFNAGGGESFGYEPHLLIELEIGREDTDTGRGGQLVHIASVLKDRSQMLNGDQITFHELRGYKKGDYAQVWNAFFPHTQEMQNIENHVLIPATSSAKPQSDSHYAQSQKEKTIALEEIKESLEVIAGGKTDAAKSMKRKISECLFDCRAWAAVEAKSLMELQRGLLILQKLEEWLKENQVSTEKEMLELLAKAAQSVHEEAFAEKQKDEMPSGEPVPF